MDELIFDRLASDVETALNNPKSSSHLKGSYNYTDLNRVEEWCDYLQNILQKYGFPYTLEVKTNWSLTDFPTRKHLDRIRQNIDKLKDFCYALSTETIIYNNTMNYEQANVLEKILYDVNKYFEDMNIKLNLQYNVGTTLINRKYIDLPMNMDVIIVEKQVPTDYDVGILLINRKYITLKGV